MSQAQLAAGMDRLPWLDDEEEEPRQPAPRGRRALFGWAVAAMMLVAGISYWMGANSGREPNLTGKSRWSGTTVPLPDVQPAQPQVEAAPVREVQPVPAPAVEAPQVEAPVGREAPAKRTTRKRLSSTDTSEDRLIKTVAEQERAPAKTKSATLNTTTARSIARPQPLRLWPSRVSGGASGRLVQIGAFGSRQQAKLGWRRMTRAYPAVGRLPAVVVTSRNSRGRLFYRFQIGTTSQAHSEVLCQRMERIRFSCAVVGLSWKTKVER
jgi:outer membrane biosynthesis protein TonB